MNPFKQIAPTDHFGWHAAYLDVYAKLFEPLRESGKPLLEIGTDGGGGLLMYEDYFAGSAIVGFDPYFCPDTIKDSENIFHFGKDAYTEDALATARGFGKFGVIIDDGPHSIQSQQWFVKHYPHLLDDDGMAIVEDIQAEAHLAVLAAEVPDGFKYEVFDLRPINGRYDDMLFVITRK